MSRTVEVVKASQPHLTILLLRKIPNASNSNFKRKQHNLPDNSPHNKEAHSIGVHEYIVQKMSISIAWWTRSLSIAISTSLLCLDFTMSRIFW